MELICALLIKETRGALLSTLFRKETLINIKLSNKRDELICAEYIKAVYLLGPIEH